MTIPRRATLSISAGSLVADQAEQERTAGQLSRAAASGWLSLRRVRDESKDADRFVSLSRYDAENTGLSVVCIDAVDHGERRPRAPTTDLPPGWHSRTTDRMVTDWQAVVDHLASVGPPVAYVGFSMGALFGLPIVAAMPSIVAAVFVAGGVPGNDWTDDPGLEPLLFNAASRLGGTHLLMLSKDDDDLFPPAGVRRLFDAVVATTKEVTFSPGHHDDWNADLIATSASFLNKHIRSAT